MTYNTTIARRNEMLDVHAANFNNGYLRIYSGTQPASADTALSGNTLLAELRFAATAFPAASAGSLAANAIADDASADATGTAVRGQLKLGCSARGNIDFVPILPPPGRTRIYGGLRMTASSRAQVGYATRAQGGLRLSVAARADHYDRNAAIRLAIAALEL